MKKLILMILMILMIFSLPIAYAATNCEVSQVRNNLKRALYEYFNSPTEAQLELGKIKDLLDFYLAIPTAQDQVDCSGIGQNSGVSYDIIVLEAGNITTIIPKCSDGTTFGECSSTKPKYCYNSNLINKCGICGCASGSCTSTGSCSVSQPVQNQTNQTNQTTCTNECSSGQLSCSGNYTIVGEINFRMF